MYTMLTNNSLCFGGFRALEAGHTAGAVFNPVNNDVGVSRVPCARSPWRGLLPFSQTPRAAFRHSIRFSVRSLRARPSPGGGDADRTREPHPTDRTAASDDRCFSARLGRAVCLASSSVWRTDPIGRVIPSLSLSLSFFLFFFKARQKQIQMRFLYEWWLMVYPLWLLQPDK